MPSYNLEMYNTFLFLIDQIFSYLIVIDFESTCWREKNTYSQEISKSILYYFTYCMCDVYHCFSVCCFTWHQSLTHYSFNAVEFPAVLLNTSTGEVESEFHTYVQPQEHPILSEFCTELTGITQVKRRISVITIATCTVCALDMHYFFCFSRQMQVEEGIPLQICLSRFTRWLQNLQLKMDVVFPNNQTSSASSAPQKLCTFLTWSGKSQYYLSVFLCHMAVVCHFLVIIIN